MKKRRERGGEKEVIDNFIATLFSSYFEKSQRKMRYSLS